MGFKKVVTGEIQYVIGKFANDAEAKSIFPPGFTYRVGGTIYTVKEDVTKESGSPMRELTRSDGATEIISIESIKKDLQEPDAQILKDPSKIKEENVVKQSDSKTEPKKRGRKKKSGN